MTKYVLASSRLLFGYLELFPHRGSFDPSGRFHLFVACHVPHMKTEPWLPPAVYLLALVFGRVTAVLRCKCPNWSLKQILMDLPVHQLQ